MDTAVPASSINAAVEPARLQGTLSLDGRCVHCGAALPDHPVVRSIDGVDEAFCCTGCAAVRLLFAAAPLLDDEQAMLTGGDFHRRERARFIVLGMTCANCAVAIEQTVRALPSAAEVRVDLIARRLRLSFDPERLDVDRVVKAVTALGYGTAPEGDEAKEFALARRVARRNLQRLLIAWLCMMQVMMLSIPVYLTHGRDLEPDIAQLMRLAQMMLSAPVILYCAFPFYQAAYRSAKSGAIGMDLPVALATIVAGAASMVSVVRSSGNMYFDSITMFIALLLGSRWLQERGLARAAAYTRSLAKRQRMEAHRVTLDAAGAIVGSKTVQAQQLEAGDLIQIRPGETMPADGMVIHGSGTCSEAIITGEARGILKRPGDPVLAGSINLEQAILVSVTRSGERTAFAALTRLADAALNERPALVALAERAARRFMIGVLGIVLVSGVAWAVIDPSRVIPVIVAILVITCPCALALAGPVALAAAQASLARRGVLVTRAAAIETLGRASLVVFDKTGTLTRGEMSVVKTDLLRPLPAALAGVFLASSADSIRASNDVNEQAKENALVLAVALEQISNHPMAAALRSALPESGKAKLPLVHDAVHRTGQGIAGTIAGVRLTLGRGQDNSAKALADRLADEDSQCVLADEYGPLAVFHCDDPLREDAPALVASLRERGMHPMLVSGDGPGPVRRAALRLGIDDTHAFATPQDKQALVRLRQARGEVVAMIGDGLNDAPVIAQADVSATLASAATLAQTSADFIVLSNRLEDLNAAFGLSARALNVMRGNLLWALGYNVVAIPVAALGYVSPLWASIGMATSSLVVVANALRLLPAQKGT